MKAEVESQGAREEVKIQGTLRELRKRGFRQGRKKLGCLKRLLEEGMGSECVAQVDVLEIKCTRTLIGRR